MTTDAGTLPLSHTARRKTALATVIGNTIEFYDFTVYGMMTALIFGQIFFSDLPAAVGTFMALATFAVGFLSRPIGGILFGHFGDKFGRKPVLVASLLTMGGATALMGLLPTFEVAGWIAPVLLVLLRFVQGLGIGGEWGGAVTLMLESTPEKKRGLFGSLVQTGSGMGIILATGVVALLVAVLSTEQLLSWGWRIPLLLSVVLVVIGLIARAKIEESPEFKTLENAGEKVASLPIAETLRKHWRIVLLAIGMYIGVAAFGFTQGVYFVAYLTNTIKVDPAVAATSNLVASIFYLGATVVGGFLADKIGSLKAYIVGGIVLLPAPLLMFGAGSTGDVALIYAAMALTGFLSGIGYGAQASLFFSLFPPRVRYTGISLGFQVAAVLGGGLTPLLASAMTEATGSVVPISLYIMGLTVLLIVCSFAAPRVLKKEASLD